MPWAPPPAAVVDGPPETFEGILERVMWPREDPPGIAFRVMRVAPLYKGDPTKWIGEVAPVRRDVSYQATGVLERDKRDPSEIILRVTSLAPVVAKTTEAIEAYLASGAIPGIREVLAKKIIAKFGIETLDILDLAPWRLAEVSGIRAGSDKLKKIQASWITQRSTAANLMWLAQHGVTTNQAKKILERYGASTVAKITEDPYRLSYDVDGIGFVKADVIARSVGIAEDDPRRARAAVLHIVNTSSNGEGHCYMERRALHAEAAELVAAPAELIDEAIDKLLEQHDVIAVDLPDGSGVAIFSRMIARAEAALARRVRALLGAGLLATSGGVMPPEKAEAAIKTFEAERGMTLAPAQREGVMLASTSPILVITGGPGTGKSALQAALLVLFKGLTLTLCSPTGKAAQRMTEVTGHPAGTIHSTLGWNTKDQCFEYDSMTPLPAGVVIVDEFSMADVSIANDLFDAVKLGHRLIIIGDVDQLPSVGPGAVLRDLIASGVIPTVRLSQVFRQAEGSRIISAAHDINAGVYPRSDVDATGEFFMLPRHEKGVPPIDQDGAAKMVEKLVCERIPDRWKYDALKGEILVLTPMHKGPAGTVALNERLRARLNPPGPPELERGDRIYRVGDRVLNKKNSVMRNVFNGDTGIVTEIRKATEDDPTVLVALFDTRVVKYEPKHLAFLHLAYAISIHASQGSEAQAVIVVMLTAHYKMLARNLLYTAATRGKKLVILVTEVKAMRAALDKKKNGERLTLLAERLQGRC